MSQCLAIPKWVLVLARVGEVNKTMITRSTSDNWFFVYTNGYRELTKAKNELNSLPIEVRVSRMRPWIYRIGD